MTGSAMFMKDFITKKRLVTFEDGDRMKHCSAISRRSLVQKEEDLGVFTITCIVYVIAFCVCIMSSEVKKKFHSSLDLEEVGFG